MQEIPAEGPQLTQLSVSRQQDPANSFFLFPLLSLPSPSIAPWRTDGLIIIFFFKKKTLTGPVYFTYHAVQHS